MIFSSFMEIRSAPSPRRKIQRASTPPFFLSLTLSFFFFFEKTPGRQRSLGYRSPDLALPSLRARP